MDERVIIGRVVYDFLERRFAGELLSGADVAADYPTLPGLHIALGEAERQHRDCLSRTIADYDLVRLIGRGGFGEVYRAKNIQGNHCALKIVPREQVRESTQCRELKGVSEYMACMAKIGQKRHLLPVHHVGEAGRRYFYYTMPQADNLAAEPNYVPRTVESHLSGTETATRSARKTKLNVVDVGGIGSAVAAALETLHANHLVHCDVKPGNILCIGGEWHLGDVGLLKSLKSPVGEAGTRLYWPPEGPNEAPPQADLYALGMTLLQALTGLKAEAARTMLEQGRAGLREYLLGVPQMRERRWWPPFVERIARLCAAKPSQRFASAGAVRADMEELCRRLPELCAYKRSAIRTILGWFRRDQNKRAQSQPNRPAV